MGEFHSSIYFISEQGTETTSFFLNIPQTQHGTTYHSATARKAADRNEKEAEGESPSKDDQVADMYNGNENHLAGFAGGDCNWVIDDRNDDNHFNNNINNVVIVCCQCLCSTMSQDTTSQTVHTT